MDLKFDNNNNCKGSLQKSKTSREMINQQSDNCEPISTTTPMTPLMNGISQILPSLYLCGATCISNNILQQLSITLLINAAVELSKIPYNRQLFSNSNLKYIRFNISDRCDENIYEFFDDVAELIDDNYHQLFHSHDKKNKNTYGITLIYCVAGVSRSATLCLAYLMRYAGMTLRDAYHHIKRIRPQIRPNTGFFKQLMLYEERLYRRKSVKLIYYECLHRKIPDVYGVDYQAMENFYQQQQQRKKQKETAQNNILK